MCAAALLFVNSGCGGKAVSAQQAQTGAEGAETKSGAHVNVSAKTAAPSAAVMAVVNNIDMVLVKGGTFTMGSDAPIELDCCTNGRPAHSVTLDDYYIGAFAVTQKLWVAVMGGNPSFFRGDDLPVEQVSWNDAHQFIEKLNALTGKKYRLPTESEWEYAARGGEKSNGYKYAGGNDLNEVAWYTGNGGGKTNAVGSKKPNELLIYDMSGNVWEWVYDRHTSKYDPEPKTNPRGPEKGDYRVLRGGSWADRSRDDYFRADYRNYSSPNDQGYFYGFRLALTPD